MAKLEGQRLVADRKVTAYLLDPDHPEGGTKARFFALFGFGRDNADQLIQALLEHPEINKVIAETQSRFGTKRIVECNIASPDGRNPCIRTVWLCEPDDDVHRLVTAIPIRPPPS